MFGFLKKKTKAKKAEAPEASPQTDSDKLRADALAQARAARERIGEDTVQKIAEAIRRKENSPMEKARKQLQSADADRVADEILAMLDDD